jgi:hypothetical protein
MIVCYVKERNIVHFVCTKGKKRNGKIGIKNELVSVPEEGRVGRDSGVDFAGGTEINETGFDELGETVERARMAWSVPAFGNGEDSIIEEDTNELAVIPGAVTVVGGTITVAVTVTGVAVVVVIALETLEGEVLLHW